MKQFLFEGGRKARVARHLAFWVACALLFYYHSLYPDTPSDFLHWHLYFIALDDLLCFLPLFIFSTYIFLGILFPLFVAPRRYLLFFVSVLVMVVVNSLLGYEICRIYFHIAVPGPAQPWFERASWQTGYARGGEAAIYISTIALGIKVALAWRSKQTENTALVRRKTESDLLLAKKRIKPEFLLYSLESIHEQLSISYDTSANMILQYSDVFSFILYDCNEDFVPLEREMEALANLIDANALSRTGALHLSITGGENIQGKYVQPLLLFSIVQKLLTEVVTGSNFRIDVRDRYLSVWFGEEVFPAIPLYKTTTYASR